MSVRRRLVRASDSPLSERELIIRRLIDAPREKVCRAWTEPELMGPRGERVVDGPYAEAKEVVGGYFFLTVASLDEATAIAQRCPGLPLGLTVEVRPVADVSPVLKGVAGRPPKG